ncbi:MAG: nucleotidyltransferase family protein [Lachnospiraceae bacterium]|nr:nucleotidyltransferase family protein [Lachnospiraceae bacterium]
MRVCGIIAEFNPLHKGHEYLLKEARARSGADYLLIVMSGDYVQRGEPALCDRYARCRMALEAGADAVLLLPLPFAASSAVYFARGAVSQLKHSAVCTDLFFASESGSLEALKELIPLLKNTLPYEKRPRPNDLLGAAYLEAAETLDAGFTPHTITRIGEAHDSDTDSGALSSASAFRKRLLAGDDCADLLPDYVTGILNGYRKSARFVKTADLSDMLYHALLMRKEAGYRDYYDLSPALSDKIAAKLSLYSDPEGFAMALKSRDISLSRIRRALLHILLGLRSENIRTLCSKYDYCPYLSLLGFRAPATPLLHAIKGNADRPLISKAADARTLLAADALECFNTEMRAADLYAYLAYGSGRVSAWKRSPVILNS